MIEDSRTIGSFIQDGMMEYSGYVLLNRCIPDLRDSCKPVVRRILFTMNREKATKFTKSATIAGKVMAVHPHSTSYPTIVGMVQTDTQILPWLTGKGNFAQHTSRDLQAGAERYTEVKLSEYATEVLKDLGSKCVNWIPNYDGTIMMPEVLPVKFPMILNYCQSGIGVGMASNIPSFNMIEIAESYKKYIETGIKTDLIPDFATGGVILDSKKDIELINKTGKGSVILRGTYKFEDNTILINSIPFTTTREAIIDKVIELVKLGKLKEISDIKDLTGLNGMCIEITCKKSADLNKVIGLLYKMTPLESNFSSNMNVICDGLPKVMGTWDILDKWTEWRIDCVNKAYKYEISELNNKLHIYDGLSKVINFIDEAIHIIKNSSEETMIQELVKKLGIDTVQAEHIADMKLRNINKSYINKFMNDKDRLIQKIKDYENLLSDENNIKKLIVDEVCKIANKFGKARKTEIIQESEIQDISKEELIEDFSCRVLVTQEGYIKKHSKFSENNKLKENDIILQDFTTTNKSTILLLTNKANRYKLPVYELDLLTPSSYGQYIPNIIQLEPDEKVIKVVSITDPSKGYIYTAYSNGKLGKVDIKSFISNNKKLQNCYNTDSELLDICYSEKDIDVIMVSSEGKSIIFNTSKINSKQSRNTQGVTSMKLADGLCVVNAKLDVDKDYKIQLETSSSKQKEVYLNDVVSSTDDREMYKYLSLKHGNQGNFIWNMRSYKDDKIAKVTFIK